MQFTDQMQRRVVPGHWPPGRIVSLVPSQTELLFDLGLGDRVVGITKFCVHPPEWFQNKPRVGGTKTLNLPKIAALRPDLIIGNKEENQQEQIEALALQYPVWMSDIETLEDALDMIRAVGQLTGKPEEAGGLVAGIETAFQQLALEMPAAPAPAAYLIWRKPYMAAGKGTFIHEMLRLAGFQNVFGHTARYPEISLSDIRESQPSVVLLSSEPYPFAAKHLAELQEACPAAQIMLVDGEMFSWYGSRLRLAPAYFSTLKNMLRR